MFAGIRILAAILLVPVFFLPVVSESPADIADSWSLKGDLLSGEGNYTAAAEAYNFSLSLDPYNAIVWDRYGTALAQTGRNNDALHAFDRAVTLDPYLVKAFIGKADLLAETGDISGALVTYEAVLARNPNNIHSLVRKGMILEQIGDATGARKAYEEGIRIADRELRVHPNEAKYDANLWNERGTALLRLGRYNEALASFDTALEINPKHQESIRNRNLVLLKIYEVKSAPPGMPPLTPGLVPETTKSGYSFPATAGLAVFAIFILVLRKAYQYR